MTVNYINFNYANDSDKETLDVINALSELENRKPHDSLRRLILEAGKERIKELSAPSEKENPQSVETPDKKDINSPCLECQAKKEV